MLIHCHAGISRSGAAACIVQAIRDLDEQGEVDAAKLEDLVVRYMLFPNDRMISLAEDELGLDSALHDAVDPAVKKVWGW